MIASVFCFIAPSCSEAISTAVASCMQTGLLPIVSYDTGIDLPDGCGTYLRPCSVEEIRQAAVQAVGLDHRSLSEQISACQKMALQRYSRREFSAEMARYLAEVLLAWRLPLEGKS